MSIRRHIAFVFGFAMILVGGFACSSIDQSATVSSSNESAWVYTPENSGMTFVTIHNETVGEINTFREISGSVTPDGSALLTIDLNSIDSANEDRDQLYRSVLFNTAQFPELTVSAQIDFEDYAELAIGERYTELLDMTIRLRGFEKKMSYYVMVTRLSEDQVLIENKAPLVLSAGDFGMTSQLVELQRMSGATTITPVVTATLSFVFERQF